VPRLSDIRLFKDIEKTDEASTPLHLESFDNRFILTKSNLGTLGALGQTHTTQGISAINSKYIKGCSHHYTDLNTDKRGGAGCDLSHGEHEAIPFSMVSSQARHPRAEENAGDLTTEILQAKSNFDNIKLENLELKGKLDTLQR
jgi:hypothetical protein